MPITEKALKIARLALNNGATDGEWRAAAMKFFEILRRNHGTAEDLDRAFSGAKPVVQGRTPEDRFKDFAEKMAQGAWAFDAVRSNSPYEKYPNYKACQPRGPSKPDSFTNAPPKEEVEGLQIDESLRNHVMRFGKHTGVRVRALPLDYIEWMLFNVTALSPPLRAAFSQERRIRSNKKA